METMALRKAFVDCNCQVNIHNLPLRAEAAVGMESFVVLKFEKKGSWLRSKIKVKKINNPHLFCSV